jgi:hypothetical protein
MELYFPPCAFQLSTETLLSIWDVRPLRSQLNVTLFCLRKAQGNSLGRVIARRRSAFCLIPAHFTFVVDNMVNGTGFSPSVSAFPCQYQSTNVPYLFIHLSLMLRNLCK